MKEAKKRRKPHILTAALILLSVLYAFMYAQAQVVHVEYADVYLKDLPEQFDGIKLLYVSDLHITSEGDVRKTQALMEQLRSAGADLLLLGGDYSDVRLWNTLRCFRDADKQALLRERAGGYAREWMASLADFPAPLGKFAVQGNHDADAAVLSDALAAGGVRLLTNESAVLEKNGARLIIAGTGDRSRNGYAPYASAQGIAAEDCCILLSHDPDALPQLFTIDAAGGGAWIDLALAGHTHGGQVRFGNFVPLNVSQYGLSYLSGWHEQISGYSLTSNGVGTSFLPVRFGAQAQAHVITLRRSLPVQ